MSKYDKLKQTNRDQIHTELQRFEVARKGLDELAADAERTVEIYQNAEQYLDDIDARFERATGLNKIDVAFYSSPLLSK